MRINKKSKKIFAAEEIPYDVNLEDNTDDGVGDVDLPNEEEDIPSDDPLINIENNIEGKYIAECERCGGIFISALSVSDVPVETIHGTCPLCDHDTDQYLKWYVESSEELVK